MEIKNLSNISLDAAGIVALADLVAVPRRTALTGTSALLDCLVLCPGLHRQQDAPDLSKGEFPICAAMTTGYVFRVENQATVAFLQAVGRTGHLTTLSVSPKAKGRSLAGQMLYDGQNASFLSNLCYLGCVNATVGVTFALAYLRDWWTLLATAILIIARLINVLVLRRRSSQGWKGEPEPSLKSDLIVLMSQDRWIRIQGDVNDVKAITSGAWLREPFLFENAAVAFATLSVYLDAVVVSNGSTGGKLLLLFLMFATVSLLGLCNEYTDVLSMYGRSMKICLPRKGYPRRLDLANELMAETGQKEWAVRLGMVNSKANEGDPAARSDKNEEITVVKEL